MEFNFQMKALDVSSIECAMTAFYYLQLFAIWISAYNKPIIQKQIEKVIKRTLNIHILLSPLTVRHFTDLRSKDNI